LRVRYNIRSLSLGYPLFCGRPAPTPGRGPEGGRLLPPIRRFCGTAPRRPQERFRTRPSRMCLAHVERTVFPDAPRQERGVEIALHLHPALAPVDALGKRLLLHRAAAVADL